MKRSLDILILSILLVIGACTANTETAHAQGFDPAFPLTGSPFSTDPTRPTMPLNPGPGGHYQIPESQPEYNNRNDWSSGQPHKPSEQFTPPAPSTHDFNVWQRGQLKATCTADSKGNIYCL